MARRTTIDLVPKVPAKLIRQLLPSDDIAINSIENSIKALNDLAQLIPAKYGWRVRTAEAFMAEWKNQEHEALIATNQLYWVDMLKMCEGYSIMSTWRVIELARSCVWSLARDDVICAALTARAALEGTAQYLQTARTVSATLDTIRHDADFNSTLVASSDLEALLLKTVFATRMPGHEEIYKPTNINTIIEKVGKIVGQDFLPQTYDLLCEVAHPNFSVDRSTS
jgi:hypothetical protein